MRRTVQTKQLKIAISGATNALLEGFSGTIYGNTPAEVARNLINRGLEDLVRNQMAARLQEAETSGLNSASSKR